MQYWNDMQDKWGFSDGNAVPPDADERRQLYITAINTIARRLGSTYEVHPYDRPGMHNWCLIIMARVGQVWDGGPETYDMEMQRAIDIADEMGLDQYVTTEVVVDEAALSEALIGLDLSKEDA